MGDQKLGRDTSRLWSKIKFTILLMGRVMAIDYGKKRTGLAVSDPLQMIATGLDTVDTKKLFDFLADYFSKESVTEIVIGEPLLESGEPSENFARVHSFIAVFKKKYASIKVTLQDERYTSRDCLLYTSPSPRDATLSRMPSSA